jgi:hypothetical protein
MHLLSCDDVGHYKHIITASLYVDQLDRGNIIQVGEDLLTILQHLDLLCYQLRYKRMDQYMHAWTRPCMTRCRSTLGDNLAMETSELALRARCLDLNTYMPRIRLLEWSFHQRLHEQLLTSMLGHTSLRQLCSDKNSYCIGTPSLYSLTSLPTRTTDHIDTPSFSSSTSAPAPVAEYITISPRIT